MNDLLKLAIDAHGGLRRCEQTERFRVAASEPDQPDPQRTHQATARRRTPSHAKTLPPSNTLAPPTRARAPVTRRQRRQIRLRTIPALYTTAAAV
jgi:hypothetical protein